MMMMIFLLKKKNTRAFTKEKINNDIETNKKKYLSS